MSERENGRIPNGLRGIAAVSLIAVGAAILLAFTNDATRDQIAANQAFALQQGLRDVLPDSGYDNLPHEDVFLATAPDLLGTTETTPVYRARQSGQPVAAVLTVHAPDGYVGRIKLLVSIKYGGGIIAVRAVEHNETPGLGDAIEADKSNWITQFAGRQLSPDATMAWQVRRDGGTVDQISGATVTSRAVVNAVRDALHYFNANRDEIFRTNPE